MATTKIISDVSVDGAVKIAPLNGSKALTSSGDGTVVESATTATELGYVHGVTSDIQNQLATKRVYFGTSNTAASTAIKVITTDTDFPTATVNNEVVPMTGVMICVKPSVTDSGRSAQMKLKVNSCKEFPIWYNQGAYISNNNASFFYADRASTYVFDGNFWQWVSNGIDNNTTYTAGSGLKLSSTQFSLNVPRVAKTANSLPGTNTAIIEEYTSGSSYNLPTDAFYHILTFEGSDNQYATQLALGMTMDVAFYRRYSSSVWQPWLRLDNPSVDSTPTASSTNPVQSGGTKAYVDEQVATKSSITIRQWVTE